MNQRNIRLSKSSIGEKEKKAVLKILDKEFLGMGSEVKFFEDKLSNFFGRDVVCVVNGTAALHLALQASGISKGDEVLVQSITYVATIQAISAVGAVPVFCDIEKDTMTLDIEDLKKKITSKTKAIIPVHYAGSVGNLDAIYEIANEFNLKVIEDSAHAFGSYYKGKKVGSFGDISCFSFDGIKNITSGEGGCIVADDSKFIDKVKDLRLLGVQKDSDKRYCGKRSYEFDVTDQGWRYHMSNIMAAIGIVQLERFEEFKLKRANLVKRYLKLLKNQKKIELLKINYENIFMHIFPIILDKSIDRESLIKKLSESGIGSGIHYYPNHFLSLYKKKIILKNTEEIYPKLLTLPMHNDLELSDVDYVIKNLLKFIKI